MSEPHPLRQRDPRRPPRGRARRLALLATGACAVGVTALAWAVDAGHTTAFDAWAVRGLRRPDDPAVPRGPAWLREAGLDLTALGRVAVLLLVAAAAAGFLLGRRRYGDALLIAAATGGGMLLNTVLKQLVDRPRPGVVPHLREVTTPSFPSGHAAFSAAVFLTLGLLLARSAPGGRFTTAYCMSAAAVATLLTGASRVYLGVHYPTDVVAGWMVGLAWAAACVALLDRVRQRGGGGRPENAAPGGEGGGRLTSHRVTTRTAEGTGRQMTTDERGDDADADDGDLGDMLQELRILLQGSQLLTGFLIVLPFADGFAKIDRAEKWVYLATFCCALTSLVLFSAPAAHHRIERPLPDRVQFKHFATRMILAGLGALSFALVLAAQLVVAEVLGLTASLVAAGGVAALVGGVWWLMPVAKRAIRASRRAG